MTFCIIANFPRNSLEIEIVTNSREEEELIRPAYVTKYHSIQPDLYCASIGEFQLCDLPSPVLVQSFPIEPNVDLFNLMMRDQSRD